jgi:hypothetical protein
MFQVATTSGGSGYYVVPLRTVMMKSTRPRPMLVHPYHAIKRFLRGESRSWVTDPNKCISVEA